jgi:hypothetical protein
MGDPRLFVVVCFGVRCFFWPAEIHPAPGFVLGPDANVRDKLPRREFRCGAARVTIAPETNLAVALVTIGSVFIIFEDAVVVWPSLARSIVLDDLVSSLAVRHSVFSSTFRLMAWWCEREAAS